MFIEKTKMFNSQEEWGGGGIWDSLESLAEWNLECLIKV